MTNANETHATNAILAELGYDPKAELTHWQGTPIPPLHYPLPRSAPRWNIAEQVWWNGPQWTILRNSSYYLWHVMDFATPDDLRFTLHDVPKAWWLRSLDEARPGLVSKRAYVAWSYWLGRWPIDGEIRCHWPDTAHRHDVRPFANDTRERTYARHAAYSRRRRGLEGAAQSSSVLT